MNNNYIAIKNDLKPLKESLQKAREKTRHYQERAERSFEKLKVVFEDTIKACEGIKNAYIEYMKCKAKNEQSTANI